MLDFDLLDLLLMLGFGEEKEEKNGFAIAFVVLALLFLIGVVYMYVRK